LQVILVSENKAFVNIFPSRTESKFSRTTLCLMLSKDELPIYKGFITELWAIVGIVISQSILCYLFNKRVWEVDMLLRQAA